MNDFNILIIEDEPGLQLALIDRLEAEGYDVEVESDGAAGFRRALAQSFDLILLDVMLPGKDGFEICRDLRARGVETSILMLTARSQVVDRVVGLKLGADDYLPKPFDPAELCARVEALLRRGALRDGKAGAQHRFGDIRVDQRRAEVTRGGKVVTLSALEWRLLLYLLEHPGELLSRDHLLDEVWGYESTPVTRTVDVHIAWLRQKLEPHPGKPRHFVTVRGLGYKFLP